MHVRGTHLKLLVKLTMHPGRLLTAEMAPVRLHTQYLACTCNMETGFGTLMGF